jgi:hypothetical protein
LSVISEFLGGAVDGVEILREARGQAPLELGHRLGDGRGSDGAGGGNHARALEELTAFHSDILR